MLLPTTIEVLSWRLEIKKQQLVITAENIRQSNYVEAYNSRGLIRAELEIRRAVNDLAAKLFWTRRYR